MTRLIDAQLGQRDVLFLIPSLRGGGAERVIVTLLKHFARPRFRMAVGVVDMRNAIFQGEIPPDVEIIDFGATRVRYALPKIATLIWRRRPDVVFSTLGHFNLALAMLRPLLPDEVRYIARETSIVSYTVRAYAMSAVWAALYRWFYKRHDLLICQSRYMQDDLVERFDYPRDRSVVINNPVDADHIRQLAAAPVELFALYAENIRLVAAGRMSAEKGFDLLIEAIAILANPRIRLILLGEGPLIGDLKRLAAAVGVAHQVHFAGFQANPYAYFARSDALVLSSRYEGFPNVVLEALACGTPVIATPAPGGTREILEGMSGCVLAKDVSAKSLADAISHWERGPRSRVNSIAIEPYTLDRVVVQYQQVFE